MKTLDDITADQSSSGCVTHHLVLVIVRSLFHSEAGEKARYTCYHKPVFLTFCSAQQTSFCMLSFKRTCLQCPRLRSHVEPWVLEPCPVSSLVPSQRLRPMWRNGWCWAAAGRSCPPWSTLLSLHCHCCPDDYVWHRRRYIYSFIYLCAVKYSEPVTRPEPPNQTSTPHLTPPPHTHTLRSPWKCISL